MLDGILGRSNFRTKCKSAITRTKTRLEVIKKKRNAMQRFLKKDIAELLKNNLDRNAYGRAEGLYIELNLSSCYDYVEECCRCISERLKEMHKQSECPEECKVAVSSLIYAAARFADLPDLRDLRNQFNEKYGKALEPYVSKEFVEKLKSNPPTTEMKFRLMQDIAQEFSVTWDPKPLEQQLQSSLLSNGAGDGQKLPRSMSEVAHVKEKQIRSSKKIDEVYTGVAGTRISHSQSCSTFDDKLEEQLKKKELENPLSSSRNDSEGNANRKPFINRIVPAPYTVTSNAAKCDNGNEDEDFGSQYKEKQTQNSEMERNGDGGSVGRATTRTRPRSVRTKYLKQSQSNMMGSSEHETDVKGTLSARVPGEVTYPLRRGDKEKQKEEEMSDNELSAPYSRSKKSPITPINGEPISELPLPPGRRRYLFPEPQPASSFKEVDGNTKCESSKGRFLPPDNHKLELPLSPKIRHIKSASFQNDGHLHPKLPSFDELAERIAALKKV